MKFFGESWVERMEPKYPIGSAWVYLGYPCVVKQLTDIDGFPEPTIQYVDSQGVIRECGCCLEGLVKPK